MPSTNTIPATIQLRHDTELARAASTRVLKDGEVFISAYTDSNNKIQRQFYVGDGTTQLKNLTPSTVTPEILEAAIENANSAGEVTLTSDTDDNTVAKTYHLFQGEESDGQGGTQPKEIGQIKIPLDMVVSDATVITATGNETTDGTTSANLTSGKKYIQFTVANTAATKFYLAVEDFFVAYSVEANATEVQLAIDANNEISASIVAVPTSKLVDDPNVEFILNGGGA